MQQHNIKLVLSQDRLKKLARSLRLGDILKGKVLKELSDDRYLIDFQGEEMTATFMGKLRPGSTIRTVVQGLSPVIVLKFFQGDEISLSIHELVHHYQRVLNSLDGFIVLKPFLGDLLQNYFQKEEEAKRQSKASKKILQGFEKISSLLRDFVFEKEAFREKDFFSFWKQAVEERNRFDTKIFVSFVEELETFLLEVPPELLLQEHATVVSLLGDLKKIVIYLDLEKYHNRSGNKSSRPAFFQIPYCQDNVYGQWACYSDGEEGFRFYVDPDRKKYLDWVDGRQDRKSLSVFSNMENKEALFWLSFFGQKAVLEEGSSLEGFARIPKVEVDFMKPGSLNFVV